MPTPLPNTYWVIPGRLLGGEHPDGDNEADTRGRVNRLRDAGIDYFIDLSEPGEAQDYTHVLPGKAQYLRCSIPDTTVPEDPVQMLDLQTTMRTQLDLGRRIYVHCRAGIGRTGLVMGCHLVEEGLDGRMALKRLNQLWRQSARSKSWPTVPQTAEQGNYILGWPRERISALSQRVDS